MAGYWASNNIRYIPQITTQGSTDYAQIVLSEQLTDTLLSNSKTLGATGYTTLSDAITTIGSAATTLTVPPGSWAAGGVTVPSNVCLQVLKGGTLTVANGTTLTINGPVDAGPYQIFSCTGTGTVVFGSLVPEVFPEWWATNTTPGTTDMTTALQAAFGSLSSGQVMLGPTTYKTTDEVLIQTHRTGIVGVTPRSTRILFRPTVAGKCGLKFQYSAASYLSRPFVRDLQIDSDLDAVQKIGLCFVDVSGGLIDNVAISSMYDSAFTSVGFWRQGRDCTYINNLEVNADIPVQESANPNAAGTSGGVNYNHVLLIGTNTNPCFLVDDGAFITGLSITGQSFMALGTHGFYWNDTTNAIPAYNLSIDGLIFEQGTDDTAYGIYISRSLATLDSVSVKNFSTGYGGDNKGMYFRLCSTVNLDGCGFAANAAPGTTEALNVNETVGEVNIRGCYWGASATATLTNQLMVYSTPILNGGTIPPTAIYQPAASIAGPYALAVASGVSGGTVISSGIDAIDQAAPANFQGLLLATDLATGYNAVIIVSLQYSEVTIISQTTDNIFANVKDNAATINIYRGATFWEVQNKTAAGRTIRLLPVGSM